MNTPEVLLSQFFGADMAKVEGVAHRSDAGEFV